MIEVELSYLMIWTALDLILYIKKKWGHFLALFNILIQAFCVWDSAHSGRGMWYIGRYMYLTCRPANGHYSLYNHSLAALVSKHFSFSPLPGSPSRVRNNWNLLLLLSFSSSVLLTDSDLLLLFPSWNLQQIMGFSKEHQFLAELGLGPRNPGCYIGGVWRGSGPVVSSTNPANNQVRVFSFESSFQVKTDRRWKIQ